MIVGFGIDIMSTARIGKAIERFGEHFLGRVYTDHERAQIEWRKSYGPQSYTAFWAVKEAAMKALGTGNRKGVRFRDIEVCHETSGKPYLQLYGVSRERADRLGVDSIVVSMSHLQDHAIASVIFEHREVPGSP
jgi:holo-[acyl-carrier protein] synthase